MWPVKVKKDVLVACGRHCCLCRKFCGTKIELHHIIPKSSGGEDTFENCIPLCFDCHCDAGHYNAKHPKGTKYSSPELTEHRNRWYKHFHEYSGKRISSNVNEVSKVVYEGQICALEGHLWREGYSDITYGNSHIYWVLNTYHEMEFRYRSPEGFAACASKISRIQFIVDNKFYSNYESLLNSGVLVTGILYSPTTQWHIADALIEVNSIQSVTD